MKMRNGLYKHTAYCPATGEIITCQRAKTLKRMVKRAHGGCWYFTHNYMVRTERK